MLIFKKIYVFILERGREHEQEGQREKERESQGLDLRTLRSRPEWKNKSQRLNQLHHSVPPNVHIIEEKIET